MSSSAPRKAKERKEGRPRDRFHQRSALRSMELMDLAFAQRMSVVNGQVVEQYTPRLVDVPLNLFTLQFFILKFRDVMMFEDVCQYISTDLCCNLRISLPYFNVEEEGAEVASSSQATRPKLVHIDEANSKAAAKLLGPEKDGSDDQTDCRTLKR